MMGMFSWKTADTKESISNSYSMRGSRPVYLLQPGELPNILEESYEGYGVFGGVDAHEWLAQAIGKELGWDSEQLSKITRSLGIEFECGHVYIQEGTGDLWRFGYQSDLIPSVKVFTGSWDVLEPALGMTPTEAIGTGLITAISVSTILSSMEAALKFSFDEDAVYEDLPASDNCEFQGFFYEDDDDSEEHY